MLHARSLLVALAVSLSMAMAPVASAIEAARPETRPARRTTTTARTTARAPRSLHESAKARKAWRVALETEGPATRVITINHPDDLQDVVGTFGTAADSKWRTHTEGYFKMAADAIAQGDAEGGVTETIFNPVRQDWKPAYAKEEAEHLASDAVILYGLQRKYSSVGSMAELGFMATLSFLKSRKTMAFIDDAHASLGAPVVRARTQSISDARYIESKIPDSFALFENQLSAVEASFTERVRFGAVLAASTQSQVRRSFIPRNDIVNRVVISGTSTQVDSPERVALKAALHKHGVLSESQAPGRPHYVDTVRSDWTPDLYRTWELPLKDKSLVNLVVVSNQESHGAVKDVGMAVFRAVVNGTYAVISLPEPVGPKGDYHRARALIDAHWKRMVKEYPWVSHYVKFVRSPKEMADVAATVARAKDTLPEQTWLGIGRSSP